jgi:hypothetical protein
VAVIIEGTVSPKADPALAQLAAAGRLIRWQESDGADALLVALGRLARRDVVLDPPVPGVRARHVRKNGLEFYILFNEGNAPVVTNCRLALGAERASVPAGIVTDSAPSGSRIHDVVQTPCRLLMGDDLNETSWSNGDPLRLPPYGLAIVVVALR